MLRDEEVRGETTHVVVRPQPQHPSAVPDATEREYLTLRPAVLSTLRRLYPALETEWENLYHDAWAEVLKQRAAGKAIKNLRALTTTIAVRRARDLIRDTHSDPAEMSAFTAIADDEPDLQEVVEVRLTADVLQQVVETLEPREAALIKLRFGLRMPGKEIEKRTGLSAKRLEKIFAKAYATIARQVDLADGGTSLWSKRQRSLLLACELGIASEAQRERARDLLARDPHCRALLSEMRSAMRDVAVVLPVPPVVLEADGRRGPIGSILDSAQQAITSLRHPAADLAATRAPSTLTEQATGGLAGGLGVTGAVKIVAACLAIGGTAAVCVQNVEPFRDHEPHKPKVAQKPKVMKKAPATNPAPTPMVARSVAQPTTGKRVRQTRTQLVAKAKARALARQPAVPVSSPTATAAASPAPAGAAEFGPGSSGSDPVAPQPAAAPKDGGGEFGP